jgi:hypothetical protein
MERKNYYGNYFLFLFQMNIQKPRGLTLVNSFLIKEVFFNKDSPFCILFFFIKSKNILFKF